MVVLVPLTQGAVALVDDEDAWVLQCNWYLHKKGYAARAEAGTGRTVLLHRDIMGEEHFMIDHVNRNRLDCQRHNLVVSTPTLNGLNNDASRVQMAKRIDGTPRYTAYLTVNRKKYSFGTFRSYWAAHLLSRINAQRYIAGKPFVGFKRAHWHLPPKRVEIPWQ